MKFLLNKDSESSLSDFSVRKIKFIYIYLFINIHKFNENVFIKLTQGYSRTKFQKKVRIRKFK